MSTNKNPLIEGFLDRVLSRVKDKLLKKRIANSPTLKKAAKTIDYYKNQFEDDYEKEFGEPLDLATKNLLVIK